jgi:hypothetical protein
MMAPVFTTEVDERNVKLMFDRLPMALKTNLRVKITSLVNELLLKVRATEPHRTGRLNAETRSFVDERENAILGRVRILGPSGRGHNVAAAALEYGAHRGFPVKSYERRSGVGVRGYRRQANIAERRFLRGPAEEMRAKILAELQQAVDKSLAEVQR